VLQAEARGVRNFSVLAHHVCVEPAMRMIAADPARRVSGFLAAGHVCTVTGYQTLSTLAAEFHLPVVVTGFEPVDLLEGILGCVTQLEAGRAEVENRYTRCVQPQGNPAAQRLVERVFDVVDLPWRGLGTITQGGFALRPDYASYDARQRFSQFTNISAALAAASPAPSTTSSTETNHDAETYCASVLTGTWKPTQCPLFGKTCTPESPRGAPMVSSEGACAAYFRYPPVSEPTDA
jgi:hydrogenase expression/formation protein HypD